MEFRGHTDTKELQEPGTGGSDQVTPRLLCERPLGLPGNDGDSRNPSAVGTGPSLGSPTPLLPCPLSSTWVLPFPSPFPGPRPQHRAGPRACSPTGTPALPVPLARLSQGTGTTNWCLRRFSLPQPSLRMRWSAVGVGSRASPLQNNTSMQD